MLICVLISHEHLNAPIVATNGAAWMWDTKYYILVFKYIIYKYYTETRSVSRRINRKIICQTQH